MRSESDTEGGVASGDPLHAPGFAVLSRHRTLRAIVASASATVGRPCVAASDADELLSTLGETRLCAMVVEPGCDAEVLRRLAAAAKRDRALVILVTEDPVARLSPGADVVVLESALRDVLLLADRAASGAEPSPVSLERLVAVSLLQGSLDRALEAAADQLAAGFGVENCLISLRSDSSGSAIAAGNGSDRTLSSLAWSETAERCHAAVAAAATLIVPESYLAVSLNTPHGRGFVGLVAAGPRIFTREHQRALQAVATRLASELGWRGAHEKTAVELDRLINGPGLDPLIGTWNREALIQLTAMQAAASRRATLPLTIVVLDVVELQGINTRHGLETGDRVLRRIADTLRATLREEDLIGRWSGDEIAVVLPGIAADGGHRVAERVQAALAARSIEVVGGAVVTIEVTAGIATIQQTEEPGAALTRAARAAKKAQRGGLAIVGAESSSGMTGPRASQQLEAVREDIGAILGGAYRLLHELSRGGMGVVYRAEDLALERPVAIKMLRPDLAEDPGLLERLRAEAAMLARIQHPNLVQIYSFGQRGGDSYFVMELVEGESLEQAFERHRIEKTSMPLGELGIVIEQIAAALDTLHDRGIIHRDVKPANVILDPFRSRSVLVDVGIAARHGQNMEVSGTPGYIAPEVMAGQEAGPRSDVYGLAATAYAMLTLTLPWGDGNAAAILSRQSSGALRPPSALRAEITPTDDVIADAMSTDPGRRPASAGTFARALSEALSTIVTAGGQKTAADLETGSQPATGLGHIGSSIDSLRQTRGVVFRSVTRALGVREAARLRDVLGNDDPDLARAMADTAPLGWLPSELLVRLLAVAPELVGRERSRLARDVARACIRASFRRFFPTSAATLVPERTLSAIRNVWGRYHSWGTISSMPVSSTEIVVRLADTLRDPAVCEWTTGMLEQLLVLSGAAAPTVEHETCEARGADACLFRASWNPV